MPLVLTLHKPRDPAGQQRESRTLDEGSLSIGRGVSNGWVLQDPAQHLSKVHCVVSAVPGGGYVLTDTSSNGVFLNGAPDRMPREGQVRLADGDEFLLGEYLVRVSEVARLTSRSVAESAVASPRGALPAPSSDDPFGLDEFLQPPPARQPQPVPAPAAPAPRPDPFADPFAAARADPFGDPTDDLLGPAPPPAAGPFGEPAMRGGAASRPDPFDRDDERHPGVAGSGPPGAMPRGRGAHDPFGEHDDLLGGASPPVSWEGPSQPDSVDGAAQAFRPAQLVAAPDMDDWDALLGDTPPGHAAASPPANAAPVPTPAPASPPAPPAAPLAGADAQALLAAFLSGAGVPRLDVGAQDPEAYFRGVGELFALMIESLRDVLMSRSAVKGEFGVEQTMLRARDNNALKFSVTSLDAVAALLQPGRPGYMAPERAAREAFEDIRLHQLAVMAGVQAALFNLLRTFDPDTLERRLHKGSVIESVLPGARRAKLWDAFCASYKEIARDADGDFQTVFGREFARAYAQQMGSP